MLGEPQQFDRTVAYPGGLRHLQVYYAPRMRGGGVDGIYSIVIDVTPRVQADLALQDARAALAGARERERIADRLRNLVIQRLSAAGLAARRAAPGVAHAQVRSVQDIVGALEDLESAITTLHENVGLDLLPDLARLVHNAAQPNDTAAAIGNVGSVEYVPTAVGAELLPVAEAALSNVAIHSGASSVVVTIAADAAGVWLRIVDDGRGIGPNRRVKAWPTWPRALRVSAGRAHGIPISRPALASTSGSPCHIHLRDRVRGDPDLRTRHCRARVRGSARQSNLPSAWIILRSSSPEPPIERRLSEALIEDPLRERGSAS